MFRRFREYGPAGLVPAAWGFAIAFHFGVIGNRTALIGHAIMAALLALFSVTGRAEMRTGVLRAWWVVVTAGFVVTAAGVVGLWSAGGAALLAVALYGWMLLPAIGYGYTALAMDANAWPYAFGAIGSIVGALSYTIGLLGVAGLAIPVGLAIVGIGQTIGIVDAVVRY